MFKTISSKIERDRDYPPRQFQIDVLTRVIRGKLYDHLEHDFHQEKKDGIGEYIPLRERRPSVRYALCRIVVDDSVSLLFSEGHFPAVQCEDEATAESIAKIIKESKLNEVMIEAATTGSVGSVAIALRVLLGRVFFKAMNTQFLTPTWKKEAPDTLEKVAEQYKVKGQVLRDAGYSIADDDVHTQFWFRREWDEVAETWFAPWKVGTDMVLAVDSKNTTRHELGFVPMVWVRNLPGGDDIDGEPTFPPEAIDTQIEIDYQLSQAGRGLKYSSDPTLLIKEPAVDNDGKMVKGGGNAIVVRADGDAKMLEIGGSAAQAVIDYVHACRELALESAHGNRSSADKMAAAQSGRAMEIMNAALLNLADKLRISYGEGALLSLLRMVVKAAAKFKLMANAEQLPDFVQNKPISLRWPAWYAPTSTDLQAQAVTLTTLTAGNLMSRETAVNTLADDYDIEDIDAELAAIEVQQAKQAELDKPRMTKQTVFRNADQMVVGSKEES
jgi:Phage portal protein, SPP1 Gp6-like